MAKIYTNLFAAAALLCSGISVAYAAEGEEQAPLQPYGPDITVNFVISNDEGFVEGTIIAPEKLHGDYMTGREEEPITGNMTIKLVKSCRNLQVEDELVEEWEDVAPNTELSYVDTDIVIGQAWNYRAIAIYEGGESPTWEGTLGTYTGIRPENVTDFSITSNEGKAPVFGTLTVPNKVKDAEDFPGIAYEPARVYVMRYFREIDSWDDVEQGLAWELENPATDTPLEFVDEIDGEDTPEGTYTYKAYVEWKWGTSFEESKNIGLFPGVPNTPAEIEAQVVEGGAFVKWSPVTDAGWGGGYVNPTEVTYSVYRYLGVDENYMEKLELMAEGITATEYFDNLDGIDEQMIMVYQVCAQNAQGQSNGGKSNGIVVGPGVELPFVETFSDYSNGWSYQPNMLWSSLGIKGTYGDVVYWTVGSCAYIIPSYDQIYPEGYDPQVGPESTGHGIAYTNFTSYNPSGTVSYTSGAIDFSDYEFGKVTFEYYGDPQAAVKLYVDVLCDGSVAEAEADENGQPFVNVWNGVVYAEEAGWCTQEVYFAGFADCNEISLRLRAVSDQTAEDTIFIPAAVDYIMVEGADEDPTKVEAINSNEVSVEYYDLQGIRLASPVKGQPTICKKVMNDGSVKTSKIIVR